MANLGSLTAILDADIKSLRSSVGSAQSQLQQYGQNTNKILSNAQKDWQRFGNVVRTVGGAIATYLSVRAITNFARTSVSEFAKMEEVLWRIERQAQLMGYAWANTEYINKFAREIGRATLGSAKEVREATQLLLTQQNLTRESYERTIKVAQSLSEVTGINLPTAVRYMTRAMTDASGAMSMFQRYGLTFTEQQKEQIKTLQESGRETEAYALMLDLMAQRLPDAAEGGDTLAHSLDTLSERIQEVRERVGAQLAPAVKLLVDRFSDWVAVNDAFIDQQLPEFLRRMAIAGTWVIDTVQGVGRAFRLAGRAIAMMALYGEKGMLKLADIIINGPIKVLNILIDLYNRIPALPDIEPVGITGLGQRIKDELKIVQSALEAGKEDIVSVMMEPFVGREIREAIKNYTNEVNKAQTKSITPPPALDIDKRIAKEKEVQKEVKKTESVSIQAGWRATTAFEGFMQGLSDYVATYSSIADNIRSTTQYLAYDMESAFTDFFSVTSDNFLNFRSLAITVLGDIQRELARMLVRMAMAGIGGYFLGGGMNTGAPAHINVTPGGVTTAFGMHSGGIVGKDYSFKRTVPSVMFANAPRLHDGLRADEFPAILQKGETVIPAGQKEKDIKIINVLDPSVVGQYLQTQEGEELVLNIMQKNGGI